ADARVIAFPMPGGAIGPNVHMMKKAGILDRYNEVLDEFPIVVEKGGAWTSVTPGSQQYWVQAFNNVLYGRWNKIDPGYGKTVLGYFGKTPLPSDPEVVKKASEQLEKPVFDGNPLDAAPDDIPVAKAELERRGLPTDDKSIFLVVAAMVPGKGWDTNEGIRLLQGNPKIDIPLKKKEEKKPVPTAVPAAAAGPTVGPFTTTCSVEENGNVRTFRISVGAPEGAVAPAAAPGAAPVATPPTVAGEQVFPPFDGDVPLVGLSVKVGDKVTKGQVIAAVEAMKAKHDVKSPVDGTVQVIHANIGDDVDKSNPIMTIVPNA
ncbi:biotin/lipoyl-containing protein, partial [candidate division KSB1 bacterium]